MYLSLIVRDILGRRDYYSRDKIIQFVKNSKKFDSTLEELDQSAALLIFQTSKQQTWLVSTKKRLYCILDDNRETEPHINWSISNDLKFEINVRDYPEEKSIGLIEIGEKKNWLYSKKLFKKQDIKTSIFLLISVDTNRIYTASNNKYEINKVRIKDTFKKLY